MEEYYNRMKFAFPPLFPLLLQLRHNCRLSFLVIAPSTTTLPSFTMLLGRPKKRQSQQHGSKDLRPPLSWDYGPNGTIMSMLGTDPEWTHNIRAVLHEYLPSPPSSRGLLCKKVRFETVHRLENNPFPITGVCCIKRSVCKRITA